MKVHAQNFTGNRYISRTVRPSPAHGSVKGCEVGQTKNRTSTSFNWPTFVRRRGPQIKACLVIYQSRQALTILTWPRTSKRHQRRRKLRNTPENWINYIIKVENFDAIPSSDSNNCHVATLERLLEPWMPNDHNGRCWTLSHFRPKQLAVEIAVCWWQRTLAR